MQVLSTRRSGRITCQHNRAPETGSTLLPPCLKLQGQLQLYHPRLLRLLADRHQARPNLLHKLAGEWCEVQS